MRLCHEQGEKILMIDIHIHVIPEVDDGADHIEEAMEMIDIAARQGVNAFIATPHSSAFDFEPNNVRRQYNLLRGSAARRKKPVQICMGAEILCFESDMDEILHLLRNGAYPTMNGTRYVLAEFFSNASRNAIIYCLHRFLEAGYCPIMAHAERYRNLDLQTACALHEEGVLIQMNVYSVEEEAYTLIKNRVRSFLDNRLIDFAGSDAHGVGHRPPSYLPGIEYMYSHYDHAYVDAILEELAHPTGRKIEWVEPPVLSGATYINDTTDMSFQCNWWNLPEGPKEGYRLIVRFEEGGENISIYDQTDDAVWNAAKPAFAWLNPDDFEHGSYKDKIMLSLYYSDGTQKSLKLDKKSAESIEPYLRQLTLEYLEQK